MPPSGWHYVSSRKMTCAVYVVEGSVRWAPPILRKFVGQDLGRLVAWMSRQGGFRMVRMADREERRDDDEREGALG